jgi:hypothetical protein
MMLKGGIEFQLASKGVSFSDGEIIWKDVPKI